MRDIKEAVVAIAWLMHSMITGIGLILCALFPFMVLTIPELKLWQSLILYPLVIVIIISYKRSLDFYHKHM